MKPFVKVCESKVLRRSVVVCCGTKDELKKLFFDPKTFDGFEPSPKEHRETWAQLEDGWRKTVDEPDVGALGFTMRFRGDVFVVLPKWDSRVFVHEAYHAAQRMLQEIGTDDEELGAYLVEWLFEEICWGEGPGERNTKWTTRRTTTPPRTSRSGSRSGS
jgi:hypothetical protein